MVNSLIFRWEDSQALKHHCGFCERPLSHPGARASCFGTHSEPCHRFHQAMFMRNRAHTCSFCSAIDEAHYKRHQDIVSQLHIIHESCGEIDWTIGPFEPGDPESGRSDPQHSDFDIIDFDITTEGISTSKRQRKDAKCLAKAAQRARVVTQEEINYIDSVIHSTEGVSTSDGTAPAKLEEVQLIESHVLYNAHVYNSQSSRCELKKFARLPEIDVDFDTEMERIFDTLRITELVKRNLRNRGLQGKSLKIFEVMVQALKDAVVEDLVLVHKDKMEIRTRRAGYLRYINKTAHSIVEERYTDKDWKTGERIIPSSPDSSALTSVSENLVMHQSDKHDSMISIMPPPTESPDQRHLQHIHTRVSGHDGLRQNVIEPYHAPLLPLTPNIVSKRPVVLHMKATQNTKPEVSIDLDTRAWPKQSSVESKYSRQYPHTLNGKSGPKSSSVLKRPLVNEPTSRVREAWSKLAAFTPSARHDHSVKQPAVAEKNSLSQQRFTKNDSVWTGATAVQSYKKGEKSTLGCLEHEKIPNDDVHYAYPIVSQRRTRKVQREVKHKAGKVSRPEMTSSAAAAEEAGLRGGPNVLGEVSSSNSLVNSDSCLVREVPLLSFKSTSRRSIDDSQVATGSVAGKRQLSSDPVPGGLAQTAAFLWTTHGKHDSWMRFSRFFTVDQLSSPLLESLEGCLHGSSCRFKNHGVLDCPFHEPRCCCADPLRNQCYLVCPGVQVCAAGPYNRAHGERIMTLYEKNEQTKGRIMLVDDDLVSNFLDIDNSTSKPNFARVPPRLRRDHNNLDGYDARPLLRQELEFRRLFARNIRLKHPLSKRTLQAIQYENLKAGKESLVLCYCRKQVDNKASEIDKEFSKGYVSCSYRRCEFGGIFHKHCVTKLGSESVSRWYCTACETQMEMMAYKALCIPYTHEDAFKGFHAVAQIITNNGVAMGRLRSLQELHSGDIWA